MREISADVAVIGAGSGGLSVAAGAAQLGLEVVLFERGPMGGDCLNYGCVPSKALIAAATAAHTARSASRLGVRMTAEVDFAAVMAHVRGAIAAIEPHDSQARFERMGARVVRGVARFVDPRTLECGDLRVRARRIVVATGSRPSAPNIPGLARTPHLTNETIFELTARPEHLLVIGAGPIGLELGQAFRRLGSEVTMVEAAEPLAREDRDIVAPVLQQLAQDGVRLISGAQIVGLEPTFGSVRLRVQRGEERLEVTGSHLLVAAGRAPNVEDLDLAAGQVAVHRHGIVTDGGLRSTTNRAIFAVGDVTGREAFTHAAGAQAALVVRRIAFGLPGRADRLVVPRATFTDPEIASVGLSEGEARKQYGESVRVVVSRFADDDRAITEADTRGVAKLVLDRRGRVLGVTIVGAHASELIQPWILALAAHVPLRRMASFAPPYPTRGDINRRLASEWFSPVLFSPKTRALVRLLKHLA